MKKPRRLAALAGIVLLAAHAPAQDVLFDFDNAPLHISLPIDLTVDGVTAHFSATGQGFSIQRADTLGFTPAGFAGFCIYPNSVFAADLLVTFSHRLTNFSILYAPQELGCDDSARMKISAFMNGAFVGTNLTTATSPGTWPSETLTFSSAQGFNSVVIHYDARPPTCQDWGPIFLADNMAVSLAPPEIVLTNVVKLANGAFQFSFTNRPGRSFTVLSTTNVAGPSTNWTLLGGAAEVAPGQFQFTDPQATNSSKRFYRVRSP
jgi:hypothetical protein